ncbi:LPXTG cell wall anchor domain-containing protein [Pseudalkalibacillus sp. SCS-8]|uniref:LPXTG cell wall anchor domain-containing protein n=1 Tax=Pseudalkalibacillus nanhaiensis TaxID=3115291 RepID=UPI0032DA9EE7
MIRKIFFILLVAGLVFTGLHSPVLAKDHGKPPVKDLENRFNELMDLETGDDGAVKKYDSKDQVEQEMRQIMVWPLADYYVDKYFYEKDGKLYMESIDGPIRLNMDEDYTLEKVSENHYKLTQEGSNELRDDYTLTIDYSYEAGKWVFSDRMNNLGTSKGGEMPDTATSLPIMMTAGAGIMALGGLVLIAKRRFASE